MNIEQYSPQSGRFLKEDGTYINIADALGGTETGQIADIEKHAAHSGRFIKEDGTCVNIADMIANGDIGGGSDSGSSDDSAPPIVETYNGQTIQCSMSADRPIKGLNLYATCEQKTTTGAQLLDVKILTDLEESIVKYFPVEVGNGSFTLSSNVPTESSTYNLFLLSGNVNNGASSQLNGVGEGMSRTVAAENRYVTIGARKFSGNMNNPLDYNIMLNSGATALPWEPYTGGAPSPSPAYPQEIQSTSDFVVEVKNSMGGSATPQTLNVAIPEQGFYGIPVKSGGNYTDTDGQQWICDEFDFTNKKFIKRTGRIEFDGSSDENWILNSATEERTRFYINVVGADGGSTQECLCNRAIYGASNDTGICFFTSGRFYINADPSISSLELWRQYLPTHELDVIYQLAAPIEYDLSNEQVEQFKKLKSYFGTTYIDNDAVPACNMQAELVLDTKLYIDSKFTTLAGQILEMGV